MIGQSCNQRLVVECKISYDNIKKATQKVRSYLSVIAVAVGHAHLDAVLGVVEFDADVVVRGRADGTRG